MEKKSILKWVVLTGSLGFVGAASAQIEVSPKTLTKTGDGYFEYGIYQEVEPSKPFVTCVSVEDCPKRTLKTLVVKEKIIVPVEPVAIPQKNGVLVHFDFAMSKISKAEKAQLKTQLKDIKAKGSFKLRAWTDPVGGVGSSYNVKLAKARAVAVQRYLRVNGVHSKIVIDYSPPCCTMPDATADSPESIRREMRVVEIVTE